MSAPRLAPLLRGVCPACGASGCVSEVCRVRRAELPPWALGLLSGAPGPLACSRCAAPARRGLCRHCAPIVRRERRRKALQLQVGRDRDGGGALSWCGPKGLAAGRYRRVSLIGLLVTIRGVVSDRDPLAIKERCKRSVAWVAELP